MSESLSLQLIVDTAKECNLHLSDGQCQIIYSQLSAVFDGFEAMDSEGEQNE